jgi:hypothetical protein
MFVHVGVLPRRYRRIYGRRYYYGLDMHLGQERRYYLTSYHVTIYQSQLLIMTCTERLHHSITFLNK